MSESKTCAVCGVSVEAEAPNCPCCGEASWAADKQPDADESPKSRVPKKAK